MSGWLELFDDTRRWNAENILGVWHLRAAHVLSLFAALGFLKAQKCAVGAQFGRCYSDNRTTCNTFFALDTLSLHPAKYTSFAQLKCI